MAPEFSTVSVATLPSKKIPELWACRNQAAVIDHVAAAGRDQHRNRAAGYVAGVAEQVVGRSGDRGISLEEDGVSAAHAFDRSLAPHGDGIGARRVDMDARVALNLPVHKERRRVAGDGDRRTGVLPGAVDEAVDRDLLIISRRK